MSSNFSFHQAVQPKAGTVGTAGTPGVAVPEAAGGSGPSAPPPASSLITFLPLLLVLPLLLLSMRRQKKEADARKSLKKGDRIVTNGGMVGELVEMDERLAKIKIAPGTTVTVVASTVSPFESASADVKDAKVALEKK